MIGVGVSCVRVYVIHNWLLPGLCKTTNTIFSHFLLFFKQHRLMSMPPEDPTLYRFVEMIKVYGYPLKAIIHEKVRHWTRLSSEEGCACLKLHALVW